MSKNISNIQISQEEYDELHSLIYIASSNMNIELECILEKKIDIGIFRNIISRLKSMDTIFYNEDKFNILDIQFLDENDNNDPGGRSSISYIRRSISGIDSITNYCQNDIFENYTDMYKDRVYADKKPKILKLNSYNLKFNIKYEVDIDSDTTHISDDEDTVMKITTNIQNYKELLKQPSYIQNIPKFFRKKERHSFYTSCNNFRVDLTIVKSSNKPNRTLLGSGIFNTQETYEMEVEFLNENILNSFDESAEENFKIFLDLNHPEIVKQYLTYIGYILQVVNSSSYLIKTEEKTIIRTNYLNYIKEFKRDNFISPNPISLKDDNLDIGSQINISNNYSVTDKADGESRLLFIPHFNENNLLKKYNGRVYLINNILNIVYTGITLPGVGLTILNGEYIQKDYMGRTVYDLYCYDAYVINNENLTGLNLFSSDIAKDNRYYRLKKLIDEEFQNSESVINISYKKFYFGDNLNDDNRMLWNTALEKGKNNNIPYPILNNYKLDGLIFTPNTPLIYKKEDGTKVNVLGRRWNDNLKWKPAEENTIDFLIDIVDNFNYKYKIVHLYCGKNIYIDGRYSRVKTKFNGSGNSGDNTAYICFLEKDRFNNIVSKDGLPIYNDTIVEFRYDVKSTKENNFKWVPLRTRYDKTREYREKSKNMYGNDIMTAKSIWNSIHNPITIEMITEIKSTEDKYYSDLSVNSKNITIMRNYHNYIKKGMLTRITTLHDSDYKLSVLDIGCGRGGDIHKYYENPNITNLVGIDLFSQNIDIAKQRFKQKKTGKLNAKFYEGDCRFLLDDIEDSDITINKENFDIISLQFCLHYFYDKEQSLNNLVNNINNNLKQKGYLMGTCMNREKVINILNGKNVKEATQGNDVLWKITKENNQLDNYGTKINVFIESIGQSRDEWLVNLNEFIFKLKEKNIHLIDNGLVRFDEKLFSNFKVNNGGWDIYMSDAEREFSELNQYFIFQKNDDIDNKPESTSFGGNIYKNEIDSLLTKDEQKLLLYHCTDVMELDNFIKSKKETGFSVMLDKKAIIKNIKDLDIIEFGKTCGLKKTTLNKMCLKLGIELHNTFPNGKVKKKKKMELNTAIYNKLKAHNIH